MNKDSVKELKDINYGYPEWYYNKACMFRPTVKKVDFDKGAHKCVISKSLRLSKLEYKLLHYNVSSFNEENFIEYYLKDYLQQEAIKKIVSKYKTNEANNIKIARERYKELCNLMEKVK